LQTHLQLVLTLVIAKDLEVRITGQD